jgi:hypothetical protein
MHNLFPFDCKSKLHLFTLAMFGIQVVTNLDGNFILQIGSSGEEGLQDGSFDEATFNRPQVQHK